ncbi:hypothetical protein HID58_032584 [Brassica napus]|uniref:Secreted protein n=1 Tax=Brassica napus TaxID=3708 RepID=A0ABQ8BY18_BRANA|nr:hypothetical protein HID58_032584 [Brassica napus]
MIKTKTLSLVLSFSFCCRSVSLVPLRYAQSSGLGFGLGGRSAAEEMRLRRLICFLWILGEEAERRRILAARVLVRRFSTTSGVVAIHVDAWSSFTSQHHLGLLELSGGVRDKLCAGSGLQGKEYGVDGADLVKLRVNGFGLSCLPRFRLNRVSV